MQTPQIAFLVALLVAIIVPNSAILLSIVRSAVGRKSRMKFFIMHLAIAGTDVVRCRIIFTARRNAAMLALKALY